MERFHLRQVRLLGHLLVWMAIASLAVGTALAYWPSNPPTLPAKGGKFTDPTWGTTVMRVTDETDGGDFATAYSYWPTFNKDNSHIMVFNTGGGTNYVYHFDPVNFELVGDKEPLFATSPPSGGTPGAEDAIWSALDTTVIFGHSGLNLWAYDVDTQGWTLLRDFTGAGLVGNAAHLSQQSRSMDDDIFAFGLKNSSWNLVGYAVWKRSTDQLLLNVSDTTFDEVQIDKSGRYLAAKVASGDVRVYDLQGGTDTLLTDGAPDYAPGHSDNGTGTCLGHDNWNNQLTFRSLATPHSFYTVLAWGDNWAHDEHISCLADNEDWAGLSSYSASTPPDNYLRDEIFRVKTDGSEEVQHICHHYSHFVSYWDSPRANISRDGKYIAFTSNYANQGRLDMFIVQVPDMGPQPPVANFSGNPTSGYVPLTVAFTDLSSNSPTSWSWDFGDTGSSSAQNPSHQYTGTGSFTVSLTATNAAGEDTETKPGYITVSELPSPPVADFSGNPTSGNAPLTVAFTDLSSNSPTSWSWDFGDTGSSSAQNPSHQYTSGGSYTVSLTATNAGGEDTETKPGYINVSELPAPPVADFSGSPTSGPAPLTVNFTDLSSNSPTSWSWDFGDTGTSSAQNPSHDYTSDGSYTVSLTATNAAGEDTETKPGYITVSTGATTIFSDDFEDAFEGWTIGDVVDWYTGTPKNGTHSIRLRRDGSIQQTISTVGYNTISVSFYLGAYSLDRDNEYVEALWYDGSDWNLLKRINNKDPEEDKQLHYFEYSLPSSADDSPDFALRFRIQGSGTGDYGYVDDVVVQGYSAAPPPPPVADFSGSPTSGAAPLTVDFTDLSTNNPTSWSWDFGDTGSSSLQNPSHDYTSAGDYTVSLTATNAGGEDTETKPDYITVTSIPSEVIVYADAWSTDDWAEASVISGDLADLHYDDASYMVAQCNASTQRYSMRYTANSGYTPADVTKITIEYQAKRSHSDTPGYGLVWVREADGTWDNTAEWIPGTSETWYTWETTNVSAYMSSTGVVGFTQCACPSGSTIYTISSDVLRFRLELVGGPAPPVADFSGSPTSGDAPLTVNFTDLSTNSPTSWSWDFGDTGTSGLQNPSHDYTSAGDYTVSLTATNAGGQDTETKPDYISVTVPPPVADFSGNPTSGAAPLTVAFTDLSTNSPTSWSWDFGDTGSSSLQNPSHQYTSAGDYTVSLTATNAGGQDTETKPDYISVTVPPPVADFSGSPTSGDAPLTVNFTDLSTNSPTSWSWDFGDTGSSSLQNPSHDYTSGGDYTVSLTATNAGGQDTETKPDYISVTSGPTEVYVYPDEWDFHDNGVGTLISGGLPDVQSSNDGYMQVRCNSSNHNSGLRYRWHTGYTPAEVSKITVEYEFHCTRTDTPYYQLLIYKVAGGNTGMGGGLWTTTDQWNTWETTAVSTYMDSSGVVYCTLCGCAQNSNMYDTYVDVARIKLTLQ